jgi:Na+/melibiose symporter-like transporter
MNNMGDEDKKKEFRYSSKIHWSYGVGGFLTNFTTTALGVRLLFFYENVLLFNILLYGVIMIINGLWNMVNDPLMGYLSDRTYKFQERWGRRFPWFLPTALLVGIFYLLYYFVPFQDTMGMFFWLLIIALGFELTYSTWNTNYLALYPEKFRSEKERTKVAGINTISGQLGVATGMLLPPMIISYYDPNSYILAAIVVMIINTIIALTMIPGMKEDRELRQQQVERRERETEGSFIESLKYVTKQKNLSVYLFAHLAHQVLTFLMLASFTYWSAYVVEADDPATVEIILAASFLVGGVSSVPLWVKMGRKLGNRKGLMYGMFIATLFFIPMLFISNLVLTIINVILLGMGIGAMWTLMYPTFSDVLDENVLITNRRREGIYNGVRMFIGRSAAVLSGFIIPVIHILTNYQEGSQVQPASAVFGIRIIMIVIPMVFYLLASIVLWRFYDLTKERVINNREKLIEKGL